MMKQIELKYTQLIGRALAYNVLSAIDAKNIKKADTLEANYERKGRKDFKKIGSKKLYGSTLLVNQLMSY